MNITEELMQMKAKIETAKTEKAQIEGRLLSVMDRLDKEYGCKTLEAARKRQTQLSEQAGALKSSLEAQVKELRSKYFT